MQPSNTVEDIFHGPYTLGFEYFHFVLSFFLIAGNVHLHITPFMITWLKCSHTVALIDTGAVNGMRAFFPQAWPLFQVLIY